MTQAASQDNNGSGTGDGTGNGDGAGGSGDQGGSGGGSNTDTDQQIDLTKLNADQLAKVLENKELFNTPRIKELREKAAKADKLEKAQSDAETKNLEENKKFEELATKRADENKTLKEQLAIRDQNQALTNVLVKDGVVDLGAALKLIDRTALKSDESTGEITGVDEALKSLKTASPYLFKSGGNTTVGSAGNIANGEQAGGTAKFKRSQLRDPAFYKANEKAILEAHSKGLIEDDINGTGVAAQQ